MKLQHAIAQIALFLVLIPVARPVIANEIALSDQDKVWGLMQVWAEAKFNFPFFDQVPNLDWDASAQEYIPKAVAAEDLASYYDVLMEFAAQLHDGHTAVIPPWQMVRPGWDQPPVEVQVIDDRFFFARVGVSEELEDQRVYPGLEILEIANGIPIRSYFDDTVVRLGSRGTKQADEAIGLITLLYGPQGSTVAMKVRDVDGTERTIRLSRKSQQDNGETFQWRLLEWYRADPSIEATNLANGIAYIRISNFMRSTGRDQFREVFDNLDLQSTTGIILDIRFNPGGETSNAYSVVSYFIDEAVKGSKWQSIRYVPAYRSWGNKPEWEESDPEIIQPRTGTRYGGPLVVLTGPATFSSAEDFLVPLKSSGRAVLVGETTAGSTGNPIYVDLPGGGKFRVVSKRDLFPDGKEFVGYGIVPDVTVEPTPEDLFTGRDPVLDAGIEAITSWEPGR